MVSHIKEEHGPMALACRVLTEILGPQRRQQGDRRDCIVTELVIFYSSPNNVRLIEYEVDTGVACGTCSEEEKCHGIWCGNTCVKGRDHLNMYAYLGG
jgi:hypothetical protein